MTSTTINFQPAVIRNADMAGVHVLSIRENHILFLAGCFFVSTFLLINEWLCLVHQHQQMLETNR